MALAVYAGAGSDYGLTITTKADTLDIGSLDVKADGTAAPVALTLNDQRCNYIQYDCIRWFIKPNKR